ncbi:MAG: phosphate acyltransferase PlsX [Candidatus Omnitrophica bacterium]|nr:phosphate acyltransferase PlsX [Candidatus Omnitrophota bacterium]
MKIAVDAMGGDYAPKTTVAGAVQAKKLYDVDIVLVGKSDVIRKELSRIKHAPSDVEIVDASEVIVMREPAAASVRKKRHSSIVTGIGLLKDNKADAFVSAGNTGAVVCAATLSLRLLPGIERPGISIVIPTLKSAGLIIDVGANIDPKPIHLLQYAIMSDAYLRNIMKRQNPRIGLLNIGEEETKGTDFLKETYQLMERSDFNFIGNIEARDIFSGNCDAAVCDGFVGNVSLKILEGVGEVVSELLRRELKGNPLAKIGLLFAKNSLRRFRKRLDYSEYGGAPLLGVDGVIIIGHGRSSANAIKNAIRVAKEEVENKVNEKIVDRIRHSRSVND